MKTLQQRRKTWLGNILNKTPEQIKDNEHKKLMKRMSKVNARTHTGNFFIGRNDPCYCGNVYAGILVDDGKGGKKEKPVKFKDCCLTKHVGLVEGETTPEMEKSQKKQQVYFDKKRRLPE
jgi:hypothetical protein